MQQVTHTAENPSLSALPANPTDEQIQAQIRQELLAILVRDAVQSEIEARGLEISAECVFFECTQIKIAKALN